MTPDPVKIDATASKAVRALSQHAPESIAGCIPPEVMQVLYRHVKDMAAELLVPASFPCPEIVLSIDHDRKTRLGHYKVARDGLGLKWRVSLNLLHLDRPLGNVLSTLLHEMLHAWQHSAVGGKPGKNNHHNRQYCDAAASLGIPTDKGGHDLGIDPDGKLAAYLKRHNVEGKIELVSPKKVGKPGGSSLRKWSCEGCEEPVNVRVARGLDFAATCDHCGKSFVPME